MRIRNTMEGSIESVKRPMVIFDDQISARP
jgi:hypothetical protein